MHKGAYERVHTHVRVCVCVSQCWQTAALKPPIGITGWLMHKGDAYACVCVCVSQLLADCSSEANQQESEGGYTQTHTHEYSAYAYNNSAEI